MLLLLSTAMYLSPVRKVSHDHSVFEVRGGGGGGGERGKESYAQDQFDWREKGVIGAIRNQYQVNVYNALYF